MQKIKIVRIIARLNIGGPAIHTVLLTQGLNQESFESLLVCGSVNPDEGDMGYYAHEKGVAFNRIPQLKQELSLLSDIRAFLSLYAIINSEKPDIVHTHTAKAGALGRAAAIIYNFLHWDKKIKLVHTFHGTIFSGYFSRLQTKIFISIEKILSRFSDKLLTLSFAAKDELIALGIGKRQNIEVVPLGLELDKFLRIPLKAGNQEFVIGIIGRLAPIKNHRLFIQAAQRFISQNPSLKVKFRVVGDGRLRRELESFTSQLNIGSYMEFTGWQKDLSKVYEQMDIVVLTSLNEGTPVSLIEAMAAARAVVATDVGGVRELLGEGVRGILVRSGDLQGLVNAYEYLLKNFELRRGMALSAREYVRDAFAKERLLSDIQRIYLQLAGP